MLAALIASYGSPLGFGSDGMFDFILVGGSCRIPAHFCGIYTIKPSFGRWPVLG